MIRAVVSRNVLRLRDQRFTRERNATAKNRALADAAGTTLSQVQRILSQSLGTSIDLIESLAEVFEIKPQDLLTPYFSEKQESKPSVAYLLQGREKRAEEPLQRR